MSLLIISLVSYNTKRAFATFLAIIISVIILFAVFSLGFFLFVIKCYIFLFCIILTKTI
jgi:hypothetical protein